MEVYDWRGLVAEVMSNFQLRKHIRPFLVEPHRETEHNSNLGILDGNTGVFLDKIEAKDFGIRLFSALGKIFSLYCTGLAKIFLAISARDLYCAACLGIYPPDFTLASKYDYGYPVVGV